MTEIGYYNYYNNPRRYTPDAVQDRYQQMIDRYNSSELHSSNWDPYSDESLAIRTLDENLSSMADSVRAKCKTQDEVRQYLSEKYFGTSSITYTKRTTDPETYAMYENDFNAICYGTVGGANRNDPRLNYTQQDWETYDMETKASNRKAISRQMSNLLEANGVSLTGSEQFLISFDVYAGSATISGCEDTELMLIITNLLNSGDNSKELMYYTMQNSSNIDAESLAKYRAYQNVKNYTGYDLSKLILQNGEYYTAEGQNILSLLKTAIDESSSIGIEFKGAAYGNIKNQIDTVAQKGWNSIEDLNLSIVYSKNTGFYIDSKYLCRCISSSNWQNILQKRG